MRLDSFSSFGKIEFASRTEPFLVHLFNPTGPSSRKARNMPLIYLSVSALAIYGLFQLPAWLRDIAISFVAFIVLLAFVGFIWGVLVKALSSVVTTETKDPIQPNFSSSQKTRASRKSSENTEVELMRQEATEAALIEDEFLH